MASFRMVCPPCRTAFLVILGGAVGAVILLVGGAVSLLAGAEQAPEPKAILRGHGVAVGALAFSPDGKLLASGGGDLLGKARPELKLWDLRVGKESADLKGHTGVISAVAFRPDGKMLASASITALGLGDPDNTVRLWDVKAAKEKVVLKGGDGGLAAVAFSTDGKQVIAGSSDATVYVWAATGKKRGGFPNLEQPVQALALSPEGRVLAVGGLKGMLHLFDMRTGKRRPALKGFTGHVKSLAFSKDGKLLAAAGGFTDDEPYRRQVRVWELKTAKEKFDVTGTDGTANAVALLPAGQTVVYAHEVRDKEGVTVGSDVRLVDLASGKERTAFRAHSPPLLSLAISPDGNTIATGGLDRSIKLWDVGLLPGWKP